MRAFVLALLCACGGSYKYATSPAGGPPPPEPSKLEGRNLAPLRDSPVVRRRKTAVHWQDIVVTQSARASATTSAPSAPPPAQPLASPEPQLAEKLVVEAWLYLETANVGAAVDAIRARVEAGGGRVVSENVSGSGKTASSAAMELRVPPLQAGGTMSWIGTLGRVTSRRVLASDVSKTLFDQELALKNLELTMERLQKLAAQSGPVNDLLAIEKEMTRVRGEIEALKGEQRWLLDRVAYATITVSLTREGDQPDDELVPEARIHTGPRVAMLTLLDPGMRQRTRVGGGMSVRLQRYATFELDVFPRGDGGDSRAVLATVGTALYSGYLGYGRRRYLNPYIGARVGYGYLSGSGAPVVAGELGVELYKHEYLVVDTSVRAVAYVTNGAEAAIHATLGAAVPF